MTNDDARRMVLEGGAGLLGVWLAAAQLAAGCTPGSRTTDSPDPCADTRAVRILSGRRFVRAAGTPELEEQRFTLPFDGKFCISVRNGSGPPPHGHRVAAATVALDSRELFGPEDFNQHVDVVSVSLGLTAGEHRLAVWLRSAPGSFIEVSILGLPHPGLPFEVIPIAPRRTVTVPADHAGRIEFVVADVAGTPMSGVPVMLVVAGQPVESHGTLLIDPATNASLHTPPNDVGAPPVENAGALRVVTDAGGMGRVLFHAATEGLYVVEAWVTASDASPRWAAYIEVVPSSGRWLNLTPELATSPPPRTLANMVFDSRRVRVLLFGGARSVPWYDLWALPTPYFPEATPPPWQEISTPTRPPNPGGTAMVYVPDQDRIILFTSSLWESGGSDELEVWEFVFDDSSGLSGRWNRLRPAEGIDNMLPWPLRARGFGQAVYDTVRQRVILFGGRMLASGDGPPYYGWTRQVVYLDITAGGSGVLVGREAPATIAPRTFFGSVFDELHDRLVFLGGYNPADDLLGDAWQVTFDADPYGTWIPLAQVADPLHRSPLPRRGFTLTMDAPRERAILFAGRVGDPADPETLRVADDVWEIRLSSRDAAQWSRLSPELPSGAGPAPRDSVAAAGPSSLYINRLIVFGGSPDPGGPTLGDTWELRWEYGRFARTVFAQCSPGALFNDGSDTTTCEVQWDRRLDIRSAAIRFRRDGFLVDGVPVSRGTDLPLYDDGTHGDLHTGDDVWSRGGISYRGVVSTSLHPSALDVDLTGFGPWVGSAWTVAEIGLVPPETVSAPPSPDDPRVRLSPHALLLWDTDGAFFSSYRAVADTDVAGLDRCPFLGAFRAYTRAADFLVQNKFELATVVLARPLFDPAHDGWAASCGATYRLPAAGIGFGSTPFDGTWQVCCGLSAPGPCTKCTSLFGFSVLTRRSGGTMLHEVGHSWGSRFGYTYVPRLSDGHWIAGMRTRYTPPPNSSDIFSLLSEGGAGSALLPSELPCEFALNGPAPFDEYDLYIMGLLPSADLPAVRLFAIVTPPPIRDGVSRGTCSGLVTVAADDLVRHEGGEREPPAGVAPTTFDLSVVVVSPDSFTDAEIVFFDRLARWIASDEPLRDGLMPFSVATAGRAALSTEL